MTPDERSRVLAALIEGQPVYVQEHDGTETEVYSLEMSGSEAVGWRAKGSERLIAVASVASVSLESLTS